MGGLSHYIEQQGVAATQISLVRLHTETLRPSRALWVSFPLGRPVGAPNDPEMQMEVLRSALGLIETATEPTIVDFPEDAPAGEDLEGWACPVSLPPAEPTTEAEALAERLVQEVRLLKPWYDEARKKRGRTSIGVSGASDDDVEEMALLLAAYAAGEAWGDDPRAPYRHPMPLRLRYVADDLKAFYQEAVAAQPGRAAPSGEALNRWLFHQTTLGDVIYKIRDRVAASDDSRVNWMRRALVPAVLGERAAPPKSRLARHRR